MQVVAEWLRSTPLSHCTTPGHLLATQQRSGVTISSPDHSHASVLHIQFFPCPFNLDVSQAPPTQKYRNTFLSSFPSFLPLPHWLFGSLSLVPVTTVFPPSQLIWTPQTFLHMSIKTDKGVHQFTSLMFLVSLPSPAPFLPPWFRPSPFLSWSLAPSLCSPCLYSALKSVLHVAVHSLFCMQNLFCLPQLFTLGDYQSFVG